MAAPQLRIGEVVATLALAQDAAFGQPFESQFRSCVLADRLATAIGLDDVDRATVYWVALLRYVGCTGHAHEVSALFGDEIGLRARTLIHDASDPHVVIADLLSYVADDSVRRPIVEAALRRGRPAIAPNFAAGCEVADTLVARLDMTASVRDALRHTFERWNGQGFPYGTAGTDIPLAMRIVHLTHDMEAIARHRSPADAVAAGVDRRARTYDPALVDAFTPSGQRWLEQLALVDPRAAILACEPRPHRVLHGDALEDALCVLADVVDLKSPFMAGHSRRTAALAAAAGAHAGLEPSQVTALRHAGLVHDLGTTGIPNSIWDKPGPLTTTELDRVHVHPLLTEQMLRPLDLPTVTALASAHHERSDGSGYHRGTPTDRRDLASAILAASDVYTGLTADRADRPAFTAAEAAAEIRRLATTGRLDPRAADAVLTAAGQPPARPLRLGLPGGLTAREAEVLALAAHGLTTKTIGNQLHISAKTADHHLQHIYTKIGVTSRGAAALWAMQHGITN